MAKRFILLFGLFICFTSYVFAQKYTVSGTIKDKVGPLPGAAVYVSGYKIATATNNDGTFTIANLPPGNYDILVQMIGFYPYSKNVLISDKSVTLNITLQENATLLNEVVIKPDPDRLYHLSLFKDFFIGKTANAAECTILNTNVLVFNDDKSAGSIYATASDFLIIENKALGYRIKYLLETF